MIPARTGSSPPGTLPPLPGSPPARARSGPAAVTQGLSPATGPRPQLLEARLLWVDPVAQQWEDLRMRDLSRLLRADDLLVVNDAATLPASLRARTHRDDPVELRLAGEREDGLWDAVLLGGGEWRQRTEDREPPPRVVEGDTLVIEGDLPAGLTARVVAVPGRSRRLVRLRFDSKGAAFWDSLYRAGRPIQYSYLSGPLHLWDVQTPYAARPWAVEPPSAGLPLSWELLLALRRRGVRLARITHAAGLSSTGEATLDSTLPLPERYDIPPETVRAVADARSLGGRVVAAGTTVVRALEGCAADHDGRLESGEGVTDLRIDPEYLPTVVDGLLTGMHEPGTSHYEMLTALVGHELITRSYAHVARAGYLGHEFGDLCLILGS